MHRRHFSTGLIGAALLPAAQAQACGLSGRSGCCKALRPVAMPMPSPAWWAVKWPRAWASRWWSKPWPAPVARWPRRQWRVRPPDGHTLLLATGGHAVAGALYEKLPYHTVASFQMVSSLTFFPFLLVTAPEVKLRSVADLLAATRATAGGLAYGSAGVGSTHHLVGELLARTAGMPLLHVPYRGEAAAITAVLGGEIPLMIGTPTALMGQLKAGKLRALAATSAQRWSGMPELPTVAEQGVAGFDVRSWAGWMLPAGAPQAVVDRLHAETQRALAVPAVKARLENMGGEVRGSTATEMTAMVSAELQRWSKVMADARIPRL